MKQMCVSVGRVHERVTYYAHAEYRGTRRQPNTRPDVTNMYLSGIE